MTSPTQTGLLVEQAANKLRQEILGGQLAPGERVHLTAAASRLGMSAVPVREALRSLVSEGLVVAVPQRGYRVSPISLDDLHDIYRLRLVLDPMATTLSVPRLDDDARAELTSAMQDLQRAYDHEDPALHRLAHRRLHFGIYDHCGSPWLIRFLSILWDASYRYQRISAGPRGGLGARSKEHWQIYQACIEGDEEMAALLMRKHLESTLRTVDISDELSTESVV